MVKKKKKEKKKIEFGSKAIAHKFNKKFMNMWEPDSKLRQLFQAIEVLFSDVSKKCQSLSERQELFRTPKEIEAAFIESGKGGNESMESVYIEWVNQLWNKLIFRTHLKVRDAVQLLFLSANNTNAYGCALSARSIMEHVALLQYFYDKTPWLESKMVSHEEIRAYTENLKKVVLGSRFNWDKVMSKVTGLRELLQSGEWTRPKNEQLPQIIEMLKALDKALLAEGRLNKEKEILFLYGFYVMLFIRVGEVILYIPQRCLLLLMLNQSMMKILS